MGQCRLFCYSGELLLHVLPCPSSVLKTVPLCPSESKLIPRRPKSLYIPAKCLCISTIRFGSTVGRRKFPNLDSSVPRSCQWRNQVKLDFTASSGSETVEPVSIVLLLGRHLRWDVLVRTVAVLVLHAQLSELNATLTRQVEVYIFQTPTCTQQCGIGDVPNLRGRVFPSLPMLLHPRQ